MPAILVIFENRQIDHHRAFASQNLREPDLRHDPDVPARPRIPPHRCRSSGRGSASVLIFIPQASRNRASGSHTRMLPARTPACCSRSAIASISAACVEIPLPPSPFTFRPMTLPARTFADTMLFHASIGLSRPVKRPSPCPAGSARAAHPVASPCRAAPHRGQSPLSTCLPSPPSCGQCHFSTRQMNPAARLPSPHPSKIPCDFSSLSFLSCSSGLLYLNQFCAGQTRDPQIPADTTCRAPKIFQ